jgi:hypothetical protein
MVPVRWLLRRPPRSIIGGRDTIKKFFACGIWPLSDGWDFEVEKMESPLSMVTVPMSKLTAIITERETGADENITPMDTNNTPQVDIQGPITCARARHLNLQVISFLRNYSCAFESSMLPNDLIVLRNEGEDQQGHGKDLGGMEDQRGRPDQDGSPNRFDFVSVSDFRNSPY